MNIRKIIALAAAAGAALSTLAACSKKNKITAPVPIIEESVSDLTTATTTTAPVETFSFLILFSVVVSHTTLSIVSCAVQ